MFQHVVLKTIAIRVLSTELVRVYKRLRFDESKRKACYARYINLF